jgi:hypothetical protein
MAWTAKEQIITAQTMELNYVYSSKVTLRSREIAHIQIRGTYSGTPHDPIYVDLQTTLDDTAEAWDTEGWWWDFSPFEIPCAASPSLMSLRVKRCSAFRLVLQRSGITDTIVVDAWVRKNGNYADCTLDI